MSPQGLWVIVYLLHSRFLERTDLNRTKLSTSIFSYSIVAFLDFRNHISRGNYWLRHLNKLQVTLFKENVPVLLGWYYSYGFGLQFSIFLILIAVTCLRILRAFLQYPQ